MRMLFLMSGLVLGVSMFFAHPAGAAQAGEADRGTGLRGYGVIHGRNGEITSQTLDITGQKKTVQPQMPGFGRREKATPQNPIPAWVTADTRPLLAVGTIAEFVATSSTLVLNVDRENSKLPNAIRYRAESAGALAALEAREFPLQRMYRLTTNTVTYDARASRVKTPTRAETGRIESDAQRLPRTAFAPGKRVSVLYRLPRTSDTVPVVMNMSLLDSDQKNLRLDFNPLAARNPTTGTTTATLPRAAAHTRPKRQ
jgi:hypothetical protein